MRNKDTNSSDCKIFWINIDCLLKWISLFTIFSIFTWMLYQFISLNNNVVFFSYWKVISDSVYVVPFILVYILWLYFSYNYISYFHILKWEAKNYEWLCNILWFLLNLLVATIFYKYLMPLVIHNINNNLLSLLFFPFLFTLFFNVVWLFLFNLAWLWFKEYSTKEFLFIIYLISWIIIYIYLLSILSDWLYKNLCFSNEWKITHIVYMNDKYVFTDKDEAYPIEKVEKFLTSKNNCN